MLSKTQIESAKSADLPSVLKYLGFTLIQEGSSCYHLNEHDSLKIFLNNGIWLYKWWSRGGEVGDGIQFLQKFKGMSFRQVVFQLTFSEPHQRRTIEKSELKEKWFSTLWQTRAIKLIDLAQKNLSGQNAEPIRDYLIKERGLTLDTVTKGRLGWLPEKAHIPSKLLIPCFTSKGQLVRIRFRIDNPQKERYRLMRGSAFHWPFTLGVRCAQPLLIVESELDALLLHQELGDLIGVLALGSTAVTLSQRVFRFINDRIPVSLICMDNDKSGQSKASTLLKKIKNSIHWSVPEKYGKDPGEVWKYLDFKDWVKTGLNQYNR